MLKTSKSKTSRIIHRYQSIGWFHLLIFRFVIPVAPFSDMACVTAIRSFVYRFASFDEMSVHIQIAHILLWNSFFSTNGLIQIQLFGRFRKMCLNTGCCWRNSTDISHTKQSMLSVLVLCMQAQFRATHSYHKRSITLLLFWRRAYETWPAHLHGGWRMKALLN